jgi:hypothetical protein
MLIIFGVWVAIAGGVAVLAGLSGLRRVRRLRRNGETTWALPVTEPAAEDQPPSGSPRRMLLQYTLADGRVLERSARAQARKSASLRPGEPVLVWYDPRDPDDILIYGRWGRVSDRVFVTGGTMFVVLGAAMAIIGS